MITQEYITSFKQTQSFKVISEGFIQGDIEKTLLGQNPYRITSQYEMEDTIPSQVLVCIHILIKEGRLASKDVNEALNKIPITPLVVCLLLRYLDAYMIYQKDHHELSLDYRSLLDRFKKNESVYQELPCYRNLITSIKSNFPQSYT